VAVGWIYTTVLFEPLPIAGWIAFAVLAWIGLTVWAAITFAASAVTGSTAAAAGIGFVALLVISVLGAIPNVGRWLPGGLADPAIALAAGKPVDTGDVVSAVIGCMVITAIALVVAVVSFRRQEL
jgi:hypothetical protein